MSDWKSCDNCRFGLYDPYWCERCITYDEWKQIQCPYCGDALSEIREHNGKKYRHCYACHFEFEEK